MKLIKSVCTNLFFPQSRNSAHEFRRMAHFLSCTGIEYLEFYHDGNGRDIVGNILHDEGLKGVYIAVIPSKEQKLHLCNEDNDGRAAAVRLFKNCMDEAQAAGIKELMLNSGHIGSSVEHGLDALAASVEELFDYAAKKQYEQELLMEPCDSHMDACQLIGPYERTLAFLKRMHGAGLPLKLTMDTAHTVEEGSDFLEAVTAVKDYCNHVHFANCNITDRQSLLYGDKHLGYEYPGTECTINVLESIFNGLKQLYKDQEPLRIGLEVLCRENDAYEYFDNVWKDLEFLHKA